MTEAIDGRISVSQSQGTEGEEGTGRPDSRELYMGKMTRFWRYRGYGEPVRVSRGQVQNSELVDGKKFFGSSSDEKNGSAAYNYGKKL